MSIRVSKEQAHTAVSIFCIYVLLIPAFSANCIWVIPYLTANINRHKEHYYERYDHILVADIPETTPIQFRIPKCNQYMIQQSQFLVCYVEFNWGGDAKTLAYAQKQNHIRIYNLG